MYDTCKTGRTRQAAGAGKHPPEAAARGNKPLRFLPDVIHGTCRGAAITALCIRLRNRKNQKKGGTNKPARYEQEEKSQ